MFTNASARLEDALTRFFDTLSEVATDEAEMKQIERMVNYRFGADVSDMWVDYWYEDM